MSEVGSSGQGRVRLSRSDPIPGRVSGLPGLPAATAIRRCTSSSRDVALDPFTFVRAIGEGSYGIVEEVIERSTDKRFARKSISKNRIANGAPGSAIVRAKAMAERDALLKLRDCPNVIHCYRTYQDQSNLYYLFEIAQNGDLERVLNEKAGLAKPGAAILLGQTLLALAFMHRKQIVHRDVKPANILLGDHNRVRLSDFGTALCPGAEGANPGEFMGTPDYISPEILAKGGASPASDLWAFGCLICAVFSGSSPFHCGSALETFERIRACSYELPAIIPPDAADLIQRLLVAEPQNHLGFGASDGDYEPIRSHPFFAELEWKDFLTREVPLDPFQPAVDQRAERARLSEQRHLAMRYAGEAPVKETAVPLDGADGKIVLTDMGRILLKSEDKIHGAVLISERLNRSYEGGVLSMDDGTTSLSVRMNEDQANEWKKTIQMVIEDHD
jgi:3-phosphoinositide dependent protein kinase-1